MDMPTFTRESALNRQAYSRLREQIRHEHAGQYVVLACGKILGAATTFDAACRIIDDLENKPEYYLIFPADAEPIFGLVNDLAEAG